MLSSKHVAEFFNVTNQTVCNWVRRGIQVKGRAVYLKCKQVGGHWKFTEEQIADFVKEINSPAEKPIRSAQKEAKMARAKVMELLRP
jgi:Helix-turn-helix domain